MNIFKMTSQISALSKGFLAERALKRAQTCVFPKVISEIAALLKSTTTIRVLAFEVELDSLGVRVLNSDSLMPLLWYTLKSLIFVPS